MWVFLFSTAVFLPSSKGTLTAPLDRMVTCYR